MLCKDSWIDISWDGANLRTEKENLQVQFKQKASALMAFDDACDRAAIEIYDTHNKLYLGLSGGADSEYVAKCLHRNGIPFTPVILQYNHTVFNDHRYESWYAMHWCRTHNINPLIVNIDDYLCSAYEKLTYKKIKPRLWGGAITAGFLQKFVEEQHGKLLSGFQLEYYPDHEQMTYLESQLGNYHGFVMQESDFYIELLGADQHPWAFFYWSPEVVAAFVHQWDTTKTMAENKAIIYNTMPRPKFEYPKDLMPEHQKLIRKKLALEKWGSIDCALLGSKEQMLAQLLG